MVAHVCDHRTQEAEVGDSSVQAMRWAPISLIATKQNKLEAVNLYTTLCRVLLVTLLETGHKKALTDLREIVISWDLGSMLMTSIITASEVLPRSLKNYTQLHPCEESSNITTTAHCGKGSGPFPRFSMSWTDLERGMSWMSWDYIRLLHNLVTGVLGLIYLRKTRKWFTYLNVEELMLPSFSFVPLLLLDNSA